MNQPSSHIHRLVCTLAVIGATTAWAPRSSAAVINVDTAQVFATIQAAIDDAGTLDGHTIEVDDGNYVENLVITKDIRLVSINGRALTNITGTSGVGSLGTVVITTGSAGVEIGDIGKGFTIIGIDNGNPAVENAAVYFQGNHSGAIIRDNLIAANGDHGLLTEFGATIADFTISDNTFGGTTFFDPPADNGFANQFTTSNVPRQLVTIGGGTGGGSTSNIGFSNNAITGVAGGSNGGGEQGNTLVTIDSVTTFVVYNVFAGTTTRFGSSLRCRGTSTVIFGNSFDGSGQTPTTNYMFLANGGTANGLSTDPDPLSASVLSNSFSPGTAILDGGDTVFIGSTIQGFIDAVPPGLVLRFTGPYVENVDLNKALTVGGAFSLVGSLSVTAAGAALSAGFSPGIISSGDLSLIAGASLAVEINGTTAGTEYSQYQVTGTVDLGGATLSASGTAVSSPGDVMVIIDNDGIDPVVGQFSGLPTGAPIVVNENSLHVFYNSGNGNDVALIRGLADLQDVYVDGTFSGSTIGLDPDGAGPAQLFGIDSFATIQEGVDAVDVGGTVHVAAGAYGENVVVWKRLTLIGAGNGTNLASDTVVTSAAASVPVLVIDAGGLSVAEKITIQSIRLTGATGGGNAGSGIRIDGSGVTQFITFDNVAAVGNEGNGIAIDHTGTVGDIVVNSCVLSDNGNTGFRIPSSIGSFDGLVMTGGSVDNNGITGLTTGPSGSPNVTNITIDGTSFAGNGDALASSGSGSGDISLFLFNGNATIQNVSIVGDDAHIGIQIRGDNAFAPIGTVSLTNVSISGSYQHPATWVGSGLFVSGYTDLSGLSLTDVSIDVTPVGPTKPVINFYTDALIGDASMGTTTLGGNALADVLHISPAALDATSAMFTGATTNFDIEDRVTHVVDFAGVGLVTWDAGNLYVTPNSFAPPTTLAPDIQRAIDAAAPGDTVNVAAGLYENQLVITKNDLSIVGAGSGDDALVDTIVQSPTTLTFFFTTSADNYPIVGVQGADGVTLDNLRIDGAGRGNTNVRFTGVGWDDAGGTVQDCAIVNVRNTPIDGSQHGVAIVANASLGTPRTLAISNNFISDFQKNGTALSGADLTLTISGNTVVGAGPVDFIAQNGIQLGFGATGSISNNTVSGFSYTPFTFAASGILVYQASASVVTTGNTVSEALVGIWYITASGAITDNTVTATLAGMGTTPYWWNIVADPGEGTRPQPDVQVFDRSDSSQSVAGVTVLSNNVMRNVVDGGGNGTGIEADALGTATLEFSASENVATNFEVGIALYKDSTAVLTAVVTNNSVDGTNVIGLQNDSAVLQDASGNWWGTANATAVAARLGGASTDYTPWLAVGTDTDLGTMGFQGDFSTLHVDDDSPQVGATSRIQEGIGLVNGSTVHVASGTYVEVGQIVLNKDVDIIGDSSIRPVIMTDQDTGTGGDARGWWLVETGNTVTMQNLVLDGTGHKVWQGIRSHGTLTVADCEFTEIKFDASGPSYAGTAVTTIDASGPLTISDCTFSEIGRIGAHLFGPSTIERCTYTGKGVGDFLDYAVCVGSFGASVGSATITDCTVTGNRGVASSDGSTSGAILVSTFFGAGSEATLVGNTLMDNTIGLAVGFDSADSSNVTASFNSIVGNDFGVVNTSATNVINAEKNYWGSDDGPLDSVGTTEVDLLSCGGETLGDRLNASPAGSLGDSVSENVEYCSWLGAPARLTLEPSDGCFVTLGDTLTVVVGLTDATTSIVGGQFFLEYDVAALDFVSMQVGDSLFSVELIELVDEGLGTIDYAVSVPSGLLGTLSDSAMASITFDVVGETCTTPDLVAFRPHSPPTRLSGDSGAEVLPELNDLSAVSIDASDPVVTCPAGATVECDNPTGPSTVFGTTGATTGGISVYYNTTGPQDLSNAAYIQAQVSLTNLNGAEFFFDPTPLTGIPVVSWESIYSGVAPLTQFGLDMVRPLSTDDGSVVLPTLTAVDNVDGTPGGATSAGAVSWALTDYKPGGPVNMSGGSTNSIIRGPIAGDPMIDIEIVELQLVGATLNFSGKLTSDGLNHWFNPVIPDSQLSNFGLNGKFYVSGSLTLADSGSGVDYFEGEMTIVANAPTATGVATAVDTCTAFPAIDFTNDESGLTLCSGTGTIVRTWSAVDDCGNVTTCDQVITVEDTTDPIIGACPADVKVDADAGGCDAVVTYTLPTATDNCTGAPDVTCDFPSGTVFPSGTTVVTCTAADECGNTDDCSFSVTVNPISTLELSVELQGADDDPFSRCVTLELWECPDASPSLVLSADLEFTGGIASASFTIPCGEYTCIAARDELHTLSNTFDPIPTSGTFYAPEFVESDQLVGGNLNGDPFIDILDFGVFNLQFGTILGSADTSCSDTGPHSDLNGDSFVDSIEFGFLFANFFDEDDATCCSAAGSVAAAEGGPIDRISIAELESRGLGDLAIADLNHDGWVDRDDMAAFAAGARPPRVLTPLRARSIKKGAARQLRRK